MIQLSVKAFYLNATNDTLFSIYNTEQLNNFPAHRRQCKEINFHSECESHFAMSTSKPTGDETCESNRSVWTYFLGIHFQKNSQNQYLSHVYFWLRK